MMNGKKIGYRTTDNQDGAVRQLGEHNFLQHELATKNQEGYSNLDYKNLNLIQAQDQRNWCSSAHVQNQKIVPNVDSHLSYGKGSSSVNMIYVGKNWWDLVSYH